MSPWLAVRFETLSVFCAWHGPHFVAMPPTMRTRREGSAGWAVPGAPTARISQRFTYETTDGQLVPLSDFSMSPSIRVQLPRGIVKLGCAMQATVDGMSTIRQVPFLV